MLSICSSALAVVVDGAIRNQDRAATAKALFLMVACYCDCYCDLAWIPRFQRQSLLDAFFRLWTDPHCVDYQLLE